MMILKPKAGGNDMFQYGLVVKSVLWWRHIDEDKGAEGDAVDGGGDVGGDADDNGGVGGGEGDGDDGGVNGGDGSNIKSVTIRLLRREYTAESPASSPGSRARSVEQLVKDNICAR